MKKRYHLLLVTIFLCIGGSNIISQGQTVLPKNFKMDTRIDNIGYWQKCAELGLVPVQPMYVPAPAVYQGSKIYDSHGVLVGDSPDVPVTTDATTTQSENSIFIDPNNKLHVLNSNNSTPNPSTGGVYGADWYDSFDGGATWGGSKQGAGGSNSGDPAACINMSGRYFVGYIDAAYGQSVSYSDDQGTTWTTAKVAYGSYSNFLDKNHLWVDNSPTSSNQGYLYDGWMEYNQITVSRSITNGSTWEASQAISAGTNAGSHNQGENFKTGPNGEVYCAWAVYDSWPSDEKAIGFSKSLDGGVTWSTAFRALDNIRGIRTSGVPENMRVNSFPSMACDVSNGPHRGTLYIVWTNHGVPGVNTGNDIDVYMMKSTDKGTTWSTPLKLNQDPSGQGKTHYLAWITCDQANGNLAAIWYDNRNVSSNQAEAWMAYSYDGGVTWTDMKVSDVSFTPQPIPLMAALYMGDYLGITTFNGKTYPCWTDNRLGYCMTYVSPVDLVIPVPKVIYDTKFFNDTTTGNNNGRMDFGETIQLGLRMKNAGTADADSVTVLVSSPSPYISVPDSSAFYGNIPMSTSKSKYDCYLFNTSNSLPNGQLIPFTVTSTDKYDSVTVSSFSILSHAPAVKILEYVILDPAPGGNNNGRLDPGETVTLKIHTKNTGEYPAVDVISELTTSSPLIDLLSGPVSLGTLDAGQDSWASFQLKVSPAAYVGSAALFHNYAHSIYHSDNKDFLIKIGLIVEDWETGNFLKFPWVRYGAAQWQIDPNIKWEKQYSARTGAIDTNKTTGLKLDYNVMLTDSIAFHIKVSTVPLSNKVKFFIDGAMVGQFTGYSDTTWKLAVYPVLAGPHTFKWEYAKAFPKGSDLDEAWVDFIVFPPENKLVAYAGGNTATCAGSAFQLQGVSVNYDSLLWTTSGTGTFNDPHIMTPIYTPSQQDITAGTVDLTIHAWSANTDTLNTMTLTIAPPPAVTAGGNKEICAGTSLTISNATATNYGNLIWTTTGDGLFTNNGIINPVYTPGSQDLQAGTVRLKLEADGTVSNCPPAYDSLLLTIHPLPVVNLGNDTAICANRTITLNGTVSGGVSYLWSPSGKTTPQITVDSAGIGLGSRSISVAVTDGNGCTGNDAINVSFKDCSGIQELAGVSCNIYPNPTAGIFNIQIIAKTLQKLNILVLNSSGEIVYTLNDLEIKGVTSQKIDLSHLSQGSYILELTNGKAGLTKKLVIQK